MHSSANNSEQIIEVIQRTVELLYEQLGLLVATKPRPSTLRNYISGIEMINNCWSEESNPYDCSPGIGRLAKHLANTVSSPGYSAYALSRGGGLSMYQPSSVNTKLLEALEQSNKTVQEKYARIGELERLITEAGITVK